jgi:hypothetical protein
MWQCYQRKLFSQYVDEVRELRRKHAMGGDVMLRSDAKQQSQLKNWIEFQYYHL